MMTKVYSLPQIADVPDSLYSDDSRKILALTDNSNNVAQASGGSFILSDSSVPSLSTKIDNSPESKSFLDPSDLTNSVGSFFMPDNTEISENLPKFDTPMNLALVRMEEDPALEDGFGSGGGGVETAPQGGSGTSGSPGYSGTPGVGTGSSGGADTKKPRKSPNPGGLSASERARRKKNAAESDKDFDCSRMEALPNPYRLVGSPNQLMMGRNPRGRFCCTGGPPTSGMWDGIFYTNSPGKFVTLRTNCIEYDPEDPYCWPVENRMCGFCLRLIDSGISILYDAYSPFFNYISPTTDFPGEYQPSFPLRDIPETERQQRGRGFWNPPQRGGSVRVKSSVCPEGYLKAHPYQPAG